MIKHRKILTLTFLLVLITGCSHIYGKHGVLKDREYEYTMAQSIPPLNIPPGYSSENIQQHYPVSEKSYPQLAAKVNIDPPELNSGKYAV